MNRAMRRFALAACLLLAVLGSACGRFGYDEVGGDDDGGDGGDAGPITDAPDGTPAGVLLSCGEPTEVLDLGDTGAVDAPFYALDIAPTTTGFLVVWSAGGGRIMATGLRLNPGPRLETIQTATEITAGDNDSISVSSLGDDAMLGVDDPPGNGIELYALDEHGYERSDSKYISDHRAFGHDFVTADPVHDLFVAMGSDGSQVAAFTRDHDIHPRSGPDPSFPVPSESAAAALRVDGYTLITGNGSNCDVAQIDEAMAVVGTPQPIGMTCHHASLVQVPGSPNIVAAWNCDNDQVWTLGGDPSSTLPAFHAIYGDADNIADNPRVTASSDGVWYAFKVGVDRLGRALLDADSNPVTGGEGAVIYTATGALKAYDLQTGVDGHTFLFWLEVDTSTRLMAMKMCVP
jgi:hypothetical protein